MQSLGLADRPIPTTINDVSHLRYYTATAEFLGQYQGSGQTEAPYLCRRPDGRVVSVSHLLYVVLQQCDGATSAKGIAQAVGAELGKTITPEQVAYLLDAKLAATGLLGEVALADRAPPAPRKLLSLWFRVPIMPARWVAIVSGALTPLFAPGVVICALLGLVAIDVWLFAVRGLTDTVRIVFEDPIVLVILTPITLVAACFHEMGHATACRRGGAKPGAIGIGLYLWFVVMFNDLTDTYRLSRWGRLRADLGGIYFDTVFIVILYGAYLLTGFEPLILVMLAAQADIVAQFWPFVRLDGYYVISDLTGVPDLFPLVRPVVRTALHRGDPHPAVAALRPRVRRIVTAWVVLTIVFIAGAVVFLVLKGGPLAVEALAALGRQFDVFTTVVGTGTPGAIALAAVELALLGGPVLGGALTGGLVIVAALRRASRRGRKPKPKGSAQPSGDLAGHETELTGPGIPELTGPGIPEITDTAEISAREWDEIVVWTLAPGPLSDHHSPVGYRQDDLVSPGSSVHPVTVDRVLLAAPRGFCAGVEMAIKALSWMLRVFEPPVYCYHEIVHNQLVVDRFRNLGVVFVDDIGAVPPGAPLMLSAHGSAPEVVAAARNSTGFVVDAVCPLVTKVHHEVKVRAGKGYSVVYVGHEGHDEAVGTMAVAPGSIHLVESEADVAAMAEPVGPVALLAQTTLSHDDWSGVLAATRERFPDMWMPTRSDLCFATTNRQSALTYIAGSADAIVVIGSANSSNTVALEKVARAAGCPRVYRVNSAEELPDDLSGTVGVTAGASAPEELVTGVIGRLAPRAGVELVAVTDEDEYFPPPRELRELLTAVDALLGLCLGASRANVSPFENDRQVAASAVLTGLTGS